MGPRWEYDDPSYANGIPETFPIDHSKHSLFGASKLASDVTTLEYGRYFGMPTCCLRGGCLTAPNHSGVDLHGFLSYLLRCNVEQKEYKVLGYKGKQVRDNIHSQDVAWHDSPRADRLPPGNGRTCIGDPSRLPSEDRPNDRIQQAKGRQE